MDAETSAIINPAVLEPLFATWEEPTAYRVRAERKGAAATVVKGRRASPMTVVNNIRAAVREWREAFYAGASDTTRVLLNHWFGRPHRKTSKAGEEFEFRYYFCQREAVETLVYLKEVRKIEDLSRIIDEFGGTDATIAALGIEASENAWSRYAFKLATGAGKTKVMSLAIVWSYFHALRESDSPMARHFVMIAPNLTVYERLKEDFGEGKIFDEDPLIPPEWRGDWNMSVVLQDEASGAATGGTLYLTNIHRLHDMEKRKKGGETFDWMGPAVSKGSALDTGKALRERITSHKRVMVLNDEAHHVWDPDSAWNEAIGYLNETLTARAGEGLVAQLDFSATPKDEKGQMFKHIVCDTPLGEAVDAGIVKAPIIGSGGDLVKRASNDAAYAYEQHLLIGYARWKMSREEWKRSGKKPLMFVMCESTDAADEIARRLNSDALFKELNGKTINLHTNLKGKVKKFGKSDYRFVESENEISDEDLKALRKLSRELDENASPYCCIVSVLMLREGWDVRNVTTIVPLRALTAKSGILPEQTLGRGLRRMTPPGQAHEVVTVVEHESFANLYRTELAQEGLPIEVMDIERVPSTTVSIYPDVGRKDVTGLEILVPALAPGHRIVPKLEGLTIEDVRKEFKKYKALPLGKDAGVAIDYEGKHLFTGEVVERMKISATLLRSGIGAISYYIKELEVVSKVPGLHVVLAPLMEAFLQEILFGVKTDLFDPKLTARLGDSDVIEHVRAVFLPLIRARTTRTETRAAVAEAMALSRWKAYQVTHNERRPALEAGRTLFNLVPCNRELEVAVAQFVNAASDVAAFAKNAGPQCLRVDYLATGGRLSFYTPDFLVRMKDGNYYLVEVKGREDKETARKARAAVAWCEAASTKEVKWRYLYVPQGVYERLKSGTVEELARTCAPALEALMNEEETAAQAPLFAMIAAETEKVAEPAGLVERAVLEALPARYRSQVEQASMLFRFMEGKPGMNYAPVFTALLGSMDEASKGLVVRRLEASVPAGADAQRAWFEPYWGKIDERQVVYYKQTAQNLKRTLVFKNGLSPLGLLRSCMDYALNDSTKIGGVFEAVKESFRVDGARKMLEKVKGVNDFRNSYVAHQGKELTDVKLAERSLKEWIEVLRMLSGA